MLKLTFSTPNLVNFSTPTSARPPINWADLSWLNQTSSELSDRVEWVWAKKLQQKKIPQKYSTLKPLKHVFLKLPCHLFLIYPLIPSSVVLTSPESVRSTAGLPFPNLSFTNSPLPPLSVLSWAPCVMEILCSPCVLNTCTHTWTQMEWVYLSSFIIYLKETVFCWTFFWQSEEWAGTSVSINCQS